MRLAIYSDFAYRRHAGRIYAEQAFVVFLNTLAEFVDGCTLLGRLDPQDEPWHFPLPETVAYIALPHYRRASDPLGVLAAAGRSALRFWRVLERTDVVLLFGPNPLALLFGLIALARRRRLALGIRQDYIAYVRNRHPRKAWMHIAAVLLDAGFRLLARRCSVVAVGPAQAQRYAHARRLLPVSVTLVGEDDVVRDGERTAASTGPELVVLSVGRLDNEKNPLLLADVLWELCTGDPRWRLTVCGEGPLEATLRERLRERRVQSYASLRGFVPVGPALQEIYRGSDLFLHTSHTEGVPQVLFEAFAAGLPVVATDVGGVATVADGAALLVPPDDPSAAVSALRILAADEELRARLVRAGLDIARQSTREAQCERVANFLEATRPTC